MAVVAFDIAAFRARYPEFANVADPALNAYFSEATIYCDNTDNSLVSDVSIRAVLLNMLTAHITDLSNRAQTANLVGRISQATEGSVNVTATMDGVPGTAAWFMQTAYGASYWQATAPYRTFRYAAGRSYVNRGGYGWPR